MNTSEYPPLRAVRKGVRLLTAADVAVLPDRLPSGPVRYELHDGRLVVLPPSTAARGRAQALFIGHLFTHAERSGRLYGCVGVILRRDPDHVLAPDLAHLTAAQLPPRTSPEDYLTTAPALVVEVRERHVDLGGIDAKVVGHLAAGVVLVWVADPDARTVTAYRANQPPVVFTAADALTADPVIPGFAVPVANLLPA